jgi:hypothetical protein
MRVFASFVAIAACAACGSGGAPAPPAASDSSPSSSVAVLNPVRVERVRAELPDGYEFAGLSGRTAPLALWGFGPAWTADPPACGALADPASVGTVHGWSASGPGGIVYVVVADGPGAVDPALPDACATWTLTAGPTTGVVTLVPAPAVDGAVTSGMVTDATTVVEGGTETHTHADTFVANLGDHVAYVTVVTDPGASAPVLGPDVAAELLVKTVAAIRG